MPAARLPGYACSFNQCERMGVALVFDRDGCGHWLCLQHLEVSVKHHLSGFFEPVQTQQDSIKIGDLRCPKTKSG